MKGNIGFLAVIAGALIAFISASLGGHIYRWEFLIWLAVIIVVAGFGYLYSRWAE